MTKAASEAMTTKRTLPSQRSHSLVLWVKSIRRQGGGRKKVR